MELVVLKKIISVLLSFVIMVGLLGNITFADDVISVYLNGERLEFDVPPQMINNRTMVPMRTIFEALGARVEWTEGFGIIRAFPGDGRLIRMHTENNQFVSNYEIIIRTNFGEIETITLDVAPQIIDSRTLVPVRVVAETLGANVEWDGDAQAVLITKDIAAYQTITVSTAEEFVNAIGSNRTINIQPGIYDFAPWTVRPLSPIGGFTGFYVQGVRNLNIIGSLDGDVEFVNSYRTEFLGEWSGFFGATLLLEFSENVRIENIIFSQSGGAYNIWSSSNIAIRNVTSNRIYVGGGSDNIVFDSVKVTGNTSNNDVVEILYSNVVFRNSKFSNNESINRALFGIMGANVRIENSIISENTYNPDWELAPLNIGMGALFSIRSNGTLVVSNSFISDNVFRYGSSTTPNINIEYEDTTFENNLFGVPEFSSLGEPVG